MKWQLISFFSFIIRIAISIRVKLDSHILKNDFTLFKVSKWLQNIPYSLPTINLCFGTPSQCFNLAISLSGFTVIEQPFEKPPIMSKLFHPNSSSTFNQSYPRKSQGLHLQKTVSYYVFGDESSEVVTFPNEQPPQAKFRFLLLRSEQDYSPLGLEGFLSLKKLMYYDSHSATTSFLMYLKNTTRINRLTFSLRYSKSNDGLIVFGEDEGKHQTCSSNLSNRSPSIWSCELTQFQIGDDAVKLKGNYIEFDTVRNYIVAPSPGGQIIFNYLIKSSNHKCRNEEEDDYQILVCDKEFDYEQLPRIHLRMTEMELTLEWSNLFKYTSYQEKSVYVLLLLVQKKEEPRSQTWTLGIPGLLDSTFIFDKEQLTIGLIQSIIKDNTLSRSLFISVIIIMAMGICLKGLLLLLRKRSIVNII